MNIEISVLAHIKQTWVKSIRFVIDENVAYVELLSDRCETVLVDLVPILKVYEKDQAVIKDFLAQIIATASGLEKVVIPQDEIFKVNEK